jgi:hypothetical protein
MPNYRLELTSVSNCRLKRGDSPAPKPDPGRAGSLDFASTVTTGQPQAEAPAPNPFDPARYRLGTNYAEMIGTREHLLEVPVRKPGKEAFFRVHLTNRLETAVLEIGDETGDPESFLVDPSLWPALASEPTFGPCLLVQYQTRQGVNALWKIKLPRPGTKMNPWTRSALQVVGRAESEWVRLKSDRALGAYLAETATGITEDPEWPDYDFGKLLEIAFRDRLITSLDHPVLKRLRGEA